MCVNPNDPVFYVYVYLDPRKPGKYVYGEYMFDYEPFYVGKGSGKRAYVHLHNKNNKDLFERIQSIKTPFIMFYKKRLVEYSAFKLETDIIKEKKKKITNTGPLYNIRDEQGQRTGYEHSDETKKKISESHKGIKHTNETRKRLSESHKGMKHTNETKKKISETKKGKKENPLQKNIEKG